MSLIVLALLTPASAAYDPAKIQWGGTYMELATDPTPVAGGWEYIVDCYTNGSNSARWGIWGPADLYETMVNLDEGAEWYWGTQDLIMQYWDQSAANGQLLNEFKPPSADTNGDNVWELTGHPWEIINQWHAPNEYVGGFEANHTTLRKDAGNPWYGRTLGQDLVQVMNVGVMYGHGAGLWFTVRIVVTDPLDSLEWSRPDYGSNVAWEDSVWFDHPDYVPGLGVDFDDNGTNDVFHENYGLYPVLGNFDTGREGDFNGDGDINADDVDILCTNMGGDPGTYDLDGNGTVDEDDMVYLIEQLADYDTDGDGTADGTGTYRGDFNLDGVVNATDLQIMKAGFGLSGVGYAAGNANCDTVVNATDLQILKANFGLAASAVPEPLTIGLLAVGGLAVVRRRRK